MTNSDKDKDWYSILDASSSDGFQELKQKYLRLALLYHPDKQGPEASPQEAQRRLQRFLEVDRAWKVLSCPASRREYDLGLRANELQQSWPVDAHICEDDMSWDEDNKVYTLGCRCGGEFSVGSEEVEEEEGAIVCCDTCSLSIEVKRST